MWSDLNPVGPQPAIAVILVLALTVLGARQGARSCGPRKAVTAVTPSILLIASVFFAIPSPRHGSVGADSAAIVICLAFGFALAIENFTLLNWPYRLNAILFALLHGSLIFLLAGAFISPAGRWLGLGTLPVFWLVAVPHLIVMNRKAKQRFFEAQGLCRHCGYNLTGNVSGVCPECGCEIKQPIPE